MIIKTLILWITLREGCSKQDKDKLFKSIITKMNTNHITNDVMTKILESKYQKYNSKQLTITELTDLDKNLLSYTKEIQVNDYGDNSRKNN